MTNDVHCAALLKEGNLLGSAEVTTDTERAVRLDVDLDLSNPGGCHKQNKWSILGSRRERPATSIPGSRSLPPSPMLLVEQVPVSWTARRPWRAPGSHLPAEDAQRPAIVLVKKWSILGFTLAT